MGLLDELKKLTRPYDEDDDFIDEAEVVDEPAPAAKPNPFSGFGGESVTPQPAVSAAPRTASRPKEGRVVNLNSAAAGGQLQVVLVKPERFETAAEIADHLRDKRAVLVNLETTPKDVTRRLVDFLSGVTYAIRGKINKVSANTFIITPPNVNVVGELMNELESSGVYF